MRRDVNDLVWAVLLTVLGFALVTLPPPDATAAWMYVVMFAPIPGLALLGRYAIQRITPKGISMKDGRNGL
jgi:hypothetical protein